MEDVIHSSHPELHHHYFCVIFVVVCGGQVLTPLFYSKKIIYYLKCVVFMAGVEEHARHLMPIMKRHDLQQIHWRYSAKPKLCILDEWVGLGVLAETSNHQPRYIRG